MVRPKSRKDNSSQVQVDNMMYDNIKMHKLIKLNRDKTQNKTSIKMKPRCDPVVLDNICGGTAPETLPVLRTNCKVLLKPKCDNRCEMTVEDLKTKSRVKTFIEEESKDRDSDEFFSLIRHCVQDAVKRGLRDSVERSVRPLERKISELTDQLHTTESKLKKIQDDLVGKICHYGEEGGRHFRYLCMKSEYDKMFYQHQSSITYRQCDCESLKLEPKCSCQHSVQNISHRPSRNVVSTARPATNEMNRQCCQINLGRAPATGRPSSKSSNCQRKREPHNPPPSPLREKPVNVTKNPLLVPEDTNEAITYILDKVCPKFFVKDQNTDNKAQCIEDYKLNIMASDSNIAERLFSSDSDSSYKE